MKNYLYKTISSISLLGIALTLNANSYSYDSREWTKIVIKEAFISRQTSQDHRDTHSAPEFGWHIRKDGTFITKGGRLYSTMYVPFPLKKRVRLILVERDVFVDDIVAGVTLKPDVAKYTLTKNGDFVITERKAFYPDGNSGKNSSVKNAGEITGDFSDSVSFLGGDYTDYHRMPPGPASLLILSKRGIGHLDSSDTYNVKTYPRSMSMTQVQSINSVQGGGTFRIRGKIGWSKINYTILIGRGKNRFNILFKKAMIYLNENYNGASYFTRRDLAKALLELNKTATLNMCKCRKQKY